LTRTPGVWSDLRWIEADFLEMLSYRTRSMPAEEPKCRLKRVAADVTSQTQRTAVIAVTVAVPTLMISQLCFRSTAVPGS
jgi:O-methyltransferase involved in polyketide biosynthesis